MNTSGFTAKYFPLPQPTSRPTEPVWSSLRKRSTIGQGYESSVPVVIVIFEQHLTL